MYAWKWIFLCKHLLTRWIGVNFRIHTMSIEVGTMNCQGLCEALWDYTISVTWGLTELKQVNMQVEGKPTRSNNEGSHPKVNNACATQATIWSGQVNALHVDWAWARLLDGHWSMITWHVETNNIEVTWDGVAS